MSAPDLNAMMRTAESGADFAEICRLEAEMVASWPPEPSDADMATCATLQAWFSRQTPLVQHARTLMLQIYIIERGMGSRRGFDPVARVAELKRAIDVLRREALS